MPPPHHDSRREAPPCRHPPHPQVIGFLNPLGGHWDPSLAFVMAGAVAVSTASFALYQRRGRRPLLAEQCSLPTKTEVDGHLILGSALFGVGWGLGGFCPGPALANLSACACRPGAMPPRLATCCHVFLSGASYAPSRC